MATTYKTANMRFLSLLIIITSIDLWIQKTSTFIRSASLKNFYNIILESIVVSKMLILLLMFCFAYLQEAKPKKTISEMRIPRLFIITDLINNNKYLRPNSIWSLNNRSFIPLLSPCLRDKCFTPIVTILNTAAM